MNTVISTNEDLTRQSVEGTEIIIVNPADSFDPRILALMNQTKQQEYLLRFGNTTVYSRKNERYPNPTLNHYVLAQAVKGMKVHKAIDIGCGVGFNGNWMANNSSVEEIIFADLHPQAIIQSFEAYQLNHNTILQVTDSQIGLNATSQHKIIGRWGDARTSLSDIDGEHSVVLSAPMYLPKVCENFPMAYDWFAGVAKNIGADFIVAYSSTARDLVEAAANHHQLNMQDIHSKKLPFTAEYSDLRKNPVEFALWNKGLEINNTGAYHNIIVSRLFE